MDLYPYTVAPVSLAQYVLVPGAQKVGWLKSKEAKSPLPRTLPPSHVSRILLWTLAHRKHTHTHTVCRASRSRFTVYQYTT